MTRGLTSDVLLGAAIGSGLTALPILLALVLQLRADRRAHRRRQLLDTGRLTTAALLDPMTPEQSRAFAQQLAKAHPLTTLKPRGTDDR